MEYKPHIFYCADDFGMSDATCMRILDCKVNGCLNKISVFPNSEMENISEYLENNNDLTMSIHLNLVEGKCISPKEEVFLLVDEDGYFKYSFGGLLKLSIGRDRVEFCNQIYKELRAQIEYLSQKFPEEKKVYLDSHQHTHMIPAIFRILIKILNDDKIEVSYIRIPNEPIIPFFKALSLYPKYLSINFVKQWVLKVFAWINRPVLNEAGIKTALFFGIMFSGDMSIDKVSKLLPIYYELAKKKECDIEVLFHPGYMLSGDKLFDNRKVEFHSFYTSMGRKNEFETLHIIKCE